MKCKVKMGEGIQQKNPRSGGCVVWSNFRYLLVHKYKYKCYVEEGIQQKINVQEDASYDPILDTNQSHLAPVNLLTFLKLGHIFGQWWIWQIKRNIQKLIVSVRLKRPEKKEVFSFFFCFLSLFKQSKPVLDPMRQWLADQ